MFIQGQSMFMDADWGTRTTPPSGSMLGTITSQLFPRIRTFRNAAFSRASHPSSFGFAQRTVPPRKSRIACAKLSRSSSGSSKKTRNRAWSLGFAPRQNRNPPLGAAPSNLYAECYYRARYYDPAAGRFLCGDPLEFFPGVNFYAYVNNSPVSSFDPWGLCPCSSSSSPAPQNHPFLPITGGVSVGASAEAGLGSLGGTAMSGNLGFAESGSHMGIVASGGN
jgi:RHS repeat-associated protein